MDRRLPICLLLVALGAGPAAAVEPPAAPEPAICPQPPPAVPRGLTLRSDLGPAFWLGAVGRDSQPGLAFSLAAGWEFWPFLAVEVSWTSGLFGTDQPRPPSPGTFTTQALHAGLRASWPLDRFDLFLRAAAGIQWAAPDILVRVEGFDTRSRFSWLGGLGFFWHTPHRRFWIGLEADAMGGLDFPGVLLSAAGVVGCTLF